MPLPTQSQLCEALLMELESAGGSSKPKAIYDPVAAHFPDMAEADREAELACGHNKFTNSVQWARQRLVEETFLDPSVRGVWSLTAAGRKEAVALLASLRHASKSKPGTGPLTASVTLLSLIDDHNRTLRLQLRDRLFGISPHQFEHLSARLLRALGFRDIVVTKKSHDGGIDGHGMLRMGIVSVKAAFQCKRWQDSVGRPSIDELRGATQGKFDHAIFLTTSKFTEEARNDSFRPGCVPIVLVDGEAILTLMIEHRIGIVSQPLHIPTIDEDFFVEIAATA